MSKLKEKAKPENKEEVEVEEVKEVEVKFPEVSGTKKFQAVQVGKGFVVYNPDGARVSGVLTDVQAKDIVRQQNQAAHLK